MYYLFLFHSNYSYFNAQEGIFLQTQIMEQLFLPIYTVLSFLILINSFRYFFLIKLLIWLLREQRYIWIRLISSVALE